MTDLPPALGRLSSAHDHLVWLQTESKEWLSGEHHTITSQSDTERRGQTVYYIEADEPGSRFDSLISDCLQNLRMGLDHLAYALAVAYTQPLPNDIAEDSEFPIFGDKDRKGRNGTGDERFMNTGPGGGMRKIAGVDPVAQAIIKGLQPYQRGQEFTSDPLWQLHELSRIDKHRLPHIVVTWSDGVGFRPTTSRNSKIGPGQIISAGGVVQGRTFLASFPVRPVDPSQGMYLDVVAPLDIAFGDGTPVVAHEPVVKTLGAIYNYIIRVVVPPLRPFL